MTTHPSPPMGGLSRGQRALVPSAVLGALIFVAAEVMFFSGILSALTISRASATLGTWPPPGQPSLSSATGDLSFGTVVASGALLAVARRLLGSKPGAARHVLFVAALLGAAFVVLQVMHGSALLASGLTMTSSQQASFFFLVGGLHTVHTVAALIALFVAFRRLGRGSLSSGFFGAVQVFWYFVVIMWPVIYARVYL